MYRSVRLEVKLDNANTGRQDLLKCSKSVWIAQKWGESLDEIDSCLNCTRHYSIKLNTSISKCYKCKSAANITQHEKKLKPLPLNSRTRQEYPFSSLQILKFQHKKYSQRKILKVKQKRKEVKFYLFADDMILCLRDPKDSAKN